MNRLFTLAFVLCLSVADANADPIYTVTDLGTGPISFTTGGNGQALATNGQPVYPFEQSSNALKFPLSDGVPNPVPAPDPNPAYYGFPAVGYSDARLYAMNAAGFAAGIVTSGIGGHYGDTQAFYVQHNADGSWGQPGILWGSMNKWSADDLGDSRMSILGVNRLNQILGTGPTYPYDALYSSSPQTAFLFDLKTGKTTDIASLLPSLHNAPIPPSEQNWPGVGSWYLRSPSTALLDEQGRLLVSATDGYYGQSVHQLLLTPAGVDSSPVTVPEPSSAIAITAILAVLCAWRRPRGSMARREGYSVN